MVYLKIIHLKDQLWTVIAELLSVLLLADPFYSPDFNFQQDRLLVMKKVIAKVNDSEIFNKIVAFYHAKSKNCLLNNCIEWNILLLSNDKNNIDFDLLLLQQKSRIHKQLKNMKASLINFTFSDWKSLNKLKKRKISELKRQSEIKYSKKIEWLWKKQKGRRRSLKVHASNLVRKKLRNKQGRIRYRRKRRTMMREEALSRAKYMVLHKSDVDISEERLILLSRGLNFIPTPKWSEEVMTVNDKI